MMFPQTIKEIVRNRRLMMAVPVRLFATSLRKAASECRTISDCVELALKYSGTFLLRTDISPIQVKEEITGLLKILAQSKPKLVLEIGTASGGTLFLFARVSDPNAVIISLDLPFDRGGYSEWRTPLYESFAVGNQQVHIIREDSHSLTGLDKVKKILGECLLDFLFIDGDHTYDGVKKDFEMYSKLVRKGGIVAFHDICVHSPRTHCEVHRLWRQIKNSCSHMEIIKDPKQDWGGIGIIYI